jgi:hypothetical protein
MGRSSNLGEVEDRAGGVQGTPRRSAPVDDFLPSTTGGRINDVGFSDLPVPRIG